jgi:predicted dehydrogenase
MHNRRFNPASLAVKALLDSGNIGDPVVITAHGIEGPNTVGVRSWLGAADQGGVGMAQTVHFAYMMRWLFGRVAEVSCFTSRKGIAWMHGQVSAAFLMRFESGAIGEIVSTFAQEVGPFEHRITMYGGSGHASFVGNVVEATSPKLYGDNGLHRTEHAGPRAAEFAAPLIGFAQAIRSGGEVAVTAEEGRDAVAFIEAAYEAAETGHTVRPTSRMEG